MPFDPTTQSRQSTGQFGSRIFQKDKVDIEGMLNGAHDPIDLHGQVLRGMDFSYAHLEGANLSWADLTGANFTGANLSKANLRGANLTNANLEHADVRGTDMTDANVSGTRIIFSTTDPETVWPYELEMRMKRIYR